MADRIAIHPVWRDRAALDKFARRIAAEIERTEFVMACITGHPHRPSCPAKRDDDSPCGPKEPHELERGRCKKHGCRVVYQPPKQLHV